MKPRATPSSKPLSEGYAKSGSSEWEQVIPPFPENINGVKENRIFSTHTDHPTERQILMPHDDQSERTEYLDERRLLIEGELDASSRLDKSLLTLSAGALGLSLTFWQYIAPDPAPDTIWRLGVSWAWFALAILLMIVSFWTSQLAFRRQRDILDTSYDRKSNEEEDNDASSNNQSNEQQHNCPSVWTDWLTGLALLFFIAGIAFLGWFALSNVN